MKSIITAVLVTLTTISLTAQQRADRQTTDALPAGWVLAPGQKQNPELWHCSGYGSSWVVSKNQDGAAKITDSDSFKHAQPAVPTNLKLTAEMTGKRSVLKTSNGWLVGFDAGEFGGGLWWFSGNGKETRKLLSDNVHAIYSTPKGTLVLVGLAHLGSDYGSVYRFSETSDEVTVTWLAKIGRSPEASTLDSSGNVIVATMRSVLRITPDGEVRHLYGPEEELVYPTSVQVDVNGIITVGMRFFVLRVLPTGKGGYRGEWLMPDECTSFKLEKNVCRCMGGR